MGEEELTGLEKELHDTNPAAWERFVSDYKKYESDEESYQTSRSYIGGGGGICPPPVQPNIHNYF